MYLNTFDALDMKEKLKEKEKEKKIVETQNICSVQCDDLRGEVVLQAGPFWLLVPQVSCSFYSQSHLFQNKKNSTMSNESLLYIRMSQVL